MKNLYSWIRNKEISSSEEEVLSKLGIESSQYSSDTYSLEELKKLLFWNKVIKKVKPEINNEIQKLVTFSAWWNNDLAIAINNRENQYQVNLLIYEKPWGNIPERLKTSFIGDYSNLEEAKTKVQEVINKLNSNMPILYKYSSIELRGDKDYFFPETELTEITLPNIDITNCPDKYVKPFDVVRIHGGTYFHTGIYLGSGKVCHIHPGKDTTQAVIKEETGVEDTSGYNYDDYEIIRGSNKGMVGITSWKNFLKFMGNNPSKVSYLHLFVPYKRWEWVIEDLVKSVLGAVSYFNERGEYSAKIVKKKEDSNNCEHYANGVIHGIFVSNYAEKYKVEKKLPYGKKIKKYNDAKKMIEESRKFFQSLVVNEEEVKRITDLVNKYISSVQPQNEMKFYVEVPRINKSYRYKL